MKIIIFDGTFKTTTFINRLALGLSKKHDIYILGFNEEKKNESKNINYFSLGSNQNYYKFVFISLKYALKDNFFSVFKLIKNLILRNKKNIQKQNLDYLLNLIDPDIIHLQWISNINFFEEYLKANKYKFILSQRGYQLNVRPFVDKTKFNYLKEWYPKIDGFHSVSKSIQQLSNEIFSSKNKIDHVVYSGLNLDMFSYKPKPIFNNKKINLISIGRDHWIKGYNYAIEAMSILKQKNVLFHYTIIGVPKDSEELIYLINQFELKEYITLIPSVHQVKVYKYIQDSDLLILPSIEEGIANVCIEAMALGTVVLSSNCGGMQELITDNKTGFIIPFRSADALANKILEITKIDNEKIKTICFNAKLKIAKQHSEAKMITDMETLYKAVHESN